MCFAEEMVTTTIGWFVCEELKALRLHYKPHILFIQRSRWTMFIRLPLWNMVTFNHKSVKIIISTCLFCLFFFLFRLFYLHVSCSLSLSLIGRSQLDLFYHTEMLLHRDLSSRCQQQVLNICLCAQMCVRFVSKRKTKTPACFMAPEKKPSLIITFKGACSEKLAPACHNKTEFSLSLGSSSNRCTTLSTTSWECNVSCVHCAHCTCSRRIVNSSQR